MTFSTFLAFLPESILFLTALVLFAVCLADSRIRWARFIAMAGAWGAVIASVLCLRQEATLFNGAYCVDGFSQILKSVVAVGFVLNLLLSGELPDIRGDAKPEYYLFLTVSVCGLALLVSCIELITLVVALELSSFPLYFLVAMRREREGQRCQMESAIKYIMFGIAANGVMLFGLSYLYGLTGTTSLPHLAAKLQPVVHSPAAIAGLAMAFSGLYYKLAVFPFHFWTPDVYEGASNETAGLIASLPKIGAAAVLVRFVSLASPENSAVVLLLTLLAVASMFYGNLVALLQTDLKRLLAFSSIAHAGYALIGFVAVDQAGYAAAIYYLAGYLFMVLACFVVVCRVSPDGTNVSLTELAGLHRRAPLLAATLVVGVFALAGLPPFAGFTGKLALLTAALSKGHLILVIIAVVNTVIAAYYYLGVVREACFREAGDRPPMVIGWPTRVLCLGLMAGILVFGIAPGRILDAISSSLAAVNAPVSTTSLAIHHFLLARRTGDLSASETDHVTPGP